MVHPNELHPHAAGFDRFARAHHMQLGFIQDAVLLELALHQTEGEAGSVNGAANFFEEIGKRADVIPHARG